ncbi:MAG: hypothetical protein NBV67_02855 [Tagaea sp.]|nr:hypothetical protein [Tagaea sp.]
MSIVSKALAELERPDDQGRDWYGWTTNQLGHAFGYMAIAMVFGPLIAGGGAIIKEATDGLRADTAAGWRDSAADLFFSGCGVALFVAADGISA